MNSLKVGLPVGGIMFILTFLPSYAEAGRPITASAAESSNFKPATIKVQSQPAAPNVPGAPAASGFFPVYTLPPAQPQALAPGIAIPLQTAPQAQGQKGADAVQQALQALMNAFKTNQGNEPNRFTDWDTFEYNDNHIFSSGSKGAGNIGNGFCTAKNSNRTQVSKHYCAMLNEILNDPTSCANHAMNNIISQAGASGSGFGDLHLYCSSYSGLKDSSQRSLVFLQILSGLITQESGWNTNAVEGEWYKNGHAMGGKGLFQIGTDDVNKDGDCRDINSTSIFDPKTNMKCGACIALKNAARDGTMGNGVGDSGARGMARYFGPFRDGQLGKREAIESGVNSYCQASTSSGDGGASQTASVIGTPQRSTSAVRD